MRLRPRDLAAVLFVALAAAATTAAAAAQEARRNGRLEGRVLGPDGAPIENATVTLARRDGPAGPTTRTDREGRWTLAGVAAGSWRLTVEAAGFASRKMPLSVTGATRPPIEVRMETAVAAGPSPEVLAALGRGDEAFKAGRWAEARAEYEKLLALRPDVSPTVHELIARCHSREGNHDKALEHLQYLLEADPQNQDLRLEMAQEALLAGRIDKGLELLEGLDKSSVAARGPELYYNVAAVLLNGRRPEEAIVYLTRAVTVEPGFVAGYFRRGLAYLQVQKLAEAQADFAKVIELAPDGPQARTAREALDRLR